MRPPGAGGSLVLQGRFTAGRPLPAAAERRANAFRLPHDVLPRPAGRGAPLPDDLRRHMEQALGGDFREVRVHVDPGVAGLGAEAFTVGSQVYFAPGRYQPHGTQGRRLLGHELTHVLQQRAGRVQNPFGQGVAVVRDPYLEAEADRGAQRAAAPGVPPVPSRPTPAPPRAAQPAGRGQVVQRLVLRLSVDEMTRGSYHHLTQIGPGWTDPTGSLRPVDSNLGGRPLDQLGTTESLHVVVHGGGGSVFVNDDLNFDILDPDQFVKHLISLGLDPKRHRGTIRLISCHGAQRDRWGHSFLSRFTSALGRRGFRNAVIGFTGFVQVREGAQVFVVPPEHDREFSLRSRLKNQHEREWQELSQRRPALNAPSEEQELYHLELEIFREKFQTNTSRLSQLWKRQKLGENLVYLEAGREELGGILRPLYPERERARREFEDWHQRQLRGFNMLNTESSERPSYIS